MGYHTLRQFLNLGEMQEMLFGPNSVGGLTWADYLAIVPCISQPNTRGILHGECDRLFPLECQEFRPIAGMGNGVELCESTVDVARCDGRKVDAGVGWRDPHPNLPGDINLQLRRPRDDIPNWDPVQPRESHHQRYPREHPLNVRCMPDRGIHPVCYRCSSSHFVDSDVGRTDFPHNSGRPLQRRWARLCKRHALLIRERRHLQTTVAQNLRLGDLTRSTCECHNEVFFDGARAARMCSGCVGETSAALHNRARHWRNELMHTHRRQRRGTRPYVDFNKPARLEPGCPYRNNCGRQACIGTQQAEIMGLSVCLACSQVVIS